METNEYKLESGSLAYSIIIENGLISVHMIRKLKECRLDQVYKVVQKKASLSSGDELSFRIFYKENGQDKKFPWVQAHITNESTKALFEKLKEVLPSTTEWVDQREGDLKTDAEGRKMYDLQPLLFGSYAGAGLPRAVFLWIYLIALGVLVIPLFYFGYILIKGGYRIYTSDQALEIRKFGSKKFNWNEISNVNITNVTVVDQQHGSNTKILKMKFITSNNSVNEVVMRYDYAIPLMKELVERGLLAEDQIEKFA